VNTFRVLGLDVQWYLIIIAITSTLPLLPFCCNCVLRCAVVVSVDADRVAVDDVCCYCYLCWLSCCFSFGWYFHCCC